MTSLKKTGHSPVGASSRKRWKNCPGSVALIKTVPPLPDNKYAAEGTLAHEHAAYYLEHYKWRDDIDDEMRDHLQIYVDEVLETYATIGQLSTDDVFLIEHGFDLSSLHKDAFGTADAVIYDSVKQILYVFDLKYGAGQVVEVVDNEQLLYYAVGAFLSLNLPCIEVVLKVVQPRAPHSDGAIRDFRFYSEKLIDEADKIQKECAETDKPDAKLQAGDWCGYCAAATVCPAIKKDVLAVFDAPVEIQLDGYDREKLADSLDMIPKLEAFIKKINEAAYNEAAAGRPIPRYKLVNKRASRDWKVDSGIGKHLSKILTDSEKLKNCWTDPKPEIKSPAQVEKIVGKKLSGTLTEFIISESPGLKLVHQDEPGEPVTVNPTESFDVIDEDKDAEQFLLSN